MSRNGKGLLIAHWSKLVDGLTASPRSFYESVVAELRRREVPSDEPTRVLYREAGVLSHEREYLRVIRKQHVFDICAAPFGKGFFFSTWLSRRLPSLGALYALLAFVIVSAFLIQFVSSLGLVFGGGFVAILLIAALGVLGRMGAEDHVLATPVFGSLYRWLFNPETYYQLDTALMFQKAVQGAVNESIDGILKNRGLQALSESDRKPIMRDFFNR